MSDDRDRPGEKNAAVADRRRANAAVGVRANRHHTLLYRDGRDDPSIAVVANSERWPYSRSISLLVAIGGRRPPTAGALAAAADPRGAPVLARVTRPARNPRAPVPRGQARRGRRAAPRAPGVRADVGAIDLRRAAPGELRTNAEIEADIELMVNAARPRSAPFRHAATHPLANS